MTPSSPPPIKLVLSQLLDCWNVITGQTVRMIPSVERALFEFQKLYNKADLESTLNFIVYRNRHSDRPWHLRFEKFFDSEFAHFESLRAEAEQYDKAQAARKRAWRPTEGEKTLGAFRKTEPRAPEAPARMAKELILSNLDKLKTDLEKQ